MHDASVRHGGHCIVIGGHDRHQVHAPCGTEARLGVQGEQLTLVQRCGIIESCLENGVAIDAVGFEDPCTRVSVVGVAHGQVVLVEIEVGPGRESHIGFLSAVALILQLEDMGARISEASVAEGHVERVGVVAHVNETCEVGNLMGQEVTHIDVLLLLVPHLS